MKVSSSSKHFWRKRRFGVRAQYRITSVVLFLSLIISIQGQASSAFEDSLRTRQALIGERVNTLQSLMGIPQRVIISVVPRDERLVSVQRSKENAETFMLSFDEGFLEQLDRDELDAVIAHELGHVWIFTHHPFLQTELLANQIAMKVVPRKILVKVYEKVSLHSDEPLNMSRVLGAGD